PYGNSTPDARKVFALKLPVEPETRPTIGVRNAFTKPFTRAVKAAPTTMPTARSTTLPRSRKARKPFMVGVSSVVHDLRAGLRGSTVCPLSPPRGQLVPAPRQSAACPDRREGPPGPGRREGARARDRGGRPGTVTAATERSSVRVSGRSTRP